MKRHVAAWLGYIVVAVALTVVLWCLPHGVNPARVVVWVCLGLMAIPFALLERGYSKGFIAATTCYYLLTWLSLGASGFGWHILPDGVEDAASGFLLAAAAVAFVVAGIRGNGDDARRSSKE